MSHDVSTALQSCGFHDAECGNYTADLPIWLSLAETVGGPILDLGAGTGRVSLPLAAAGHDVTAVDLDPDLLDELARRASEQRLTVTTLAADLRSLDSGRPPEVTPARLILVPMQTIQLLGGPDGRRAAFRGIAHLAAPGAELVLSIVPEVESFDGRDASPQLLPPDLARLGGYRFESTPLAVIQAEAAGQIDMHRRRVVRTAEGDRIGEPADVVITLDPVTADEIQAEGSACGWEPLEVIPIAATDEHAGGTLIVLRLAGDAA